MQVSTQPKLNFKGVDFVNVKVEQKQPVDHESPAPLEINLVPKVFYPEDRVDEFTIIFEAKITADSFFDISIVGLGMFQLVDVKDDAIKKAFIHTNAPAIMFPYVRSFISTLTANLGSSFLQIILPPQFFTGELEEVKVQGGSEPELIPEVIAK